FLHLYKKDLKHFFSDRGAVIMSFLVPMVMAIIFGFTFGGGSSDIIENLEIKIDVVDLDQTELSKSVVKAIEDDDILIPEIVSEDDAYAHVKKGKRSAALIIPAGFAEKVKSGEDVDLKIIHDPSDQLENGVIQGKMQQIIFSSDIGKYIMPNMVEKVLKNQGASEESIKVARFYIENYFIPQMKNDSGENNDKASDKASDQKSSGSMFSSGFADFPVKIVNEQIVGQDVSSSAGYVQAIVSAMVMFLLFGVSFGAGSLLREQKTGTLKRLLTSPLTVEGILTAKLLGLMTTGLMQVYFMLIMGWLVFHLEIWAYPFQLFLMALATSLMASGLGIMLTGIAKTEEQIGSLAPLVIITLSAVGGAMVPRFIMPQILKTIGVISPVSWAMEGFHNVFWQHQGLMGMLPQFAVLIGFSIVFLIIGIVLVRVQLKKA
ncbi:ABC transporter permease, partial [bacterium]|nr:ABC transporter permease [bacterium]MBU1024374.1 ABC transporter permease [bacterium]